MNYDEPVWVISGGSWSNDALNARVAGRFGDNPSDERDYLGFRLSRIVSPLELLAEVLNEKG